jgi:hypothetical protein
MYAKSSFLYCYKQCISLIRGFAIAHATLTAALAAVIYFKE